MCALTQRYLETSETPSRSGAGQKSEAFMFRIILYQKLIYEEVNSQKSK